MEQKILVCYASGAGSTAEVADFIGKELQSNGVKVEVRRASDITEVESYSAVLLGSSIRFGRWLPDAITFLDRFSKMLLERPVAFFMTCLSIVGGSELAQNTALAYWDPILRLAPNIEPVGLGLFAGSLAPEVGQLLEYQGGPYGDYRDWDVIRSWTQEIQSALLSGKPRSSSPMTLTGTILSYTDLSGYDLSRFNFQDAEFVQTRLQNAKLQQTDLRRAKLQAADLRGADFNQASLGWADLQKAQCQGTDFSRANLIGVNLENADLQGAKLPYAILNGARLSKANLKQADLQHTDLNWADLRGSDLSGATLFKANLGWANLSDTQLSQTNLEAAHYNAQTKWPLDFSPEQAGCVLVKNRFG